jgi:hypothetical protein
MKKYFTALLFVSLAAFAGAVYELYISDSTFDARTPFGANYYIRTELNQSVAQWRPGDVASLIQNKVRSNWVYSANGNFAYVGSFSEGTPGGGGNEGGIGGGGGAGGDPLLCREDGSVCTGGGCNEWVDLVVCP